MEVYRPRVVLCFPNFSWQSSDEYTRWNLVPYALLLLAATIRDFCYVEIIDANREDLTKDEFARRIKDGKFDLLGISVLMDGFAYSGHLAAELAKKSNPDIVVVMGGVHPTIYPDLVIEDANIDYANIGEGEVSFGQLIHHLFFDAPMPEKGFAYLRDGCKVIQPRAEFITDLDSLPLPAFDLVDFNRYTNWWDRPAIQRPPLLPYASLMGSRGCPQNCNFCQVGMISGHKLRMRSPEKILDELAFYKKQYQIRSFVSMDDNLLHKRQDVVELFTGMLDRGLAMPWKALNVAVFKLDEELLELMARTGCKMIGLSIESGSSRILRDVIHKPVDLEQARRMVTVARKLGIYVSSNFIIGLPDETWDEIRHTLWYAEDVGVDYIRLSLATPYRHTRLWDECLEKKAFPPEFDPTNYRIGSGQIRSSEFDPRELTLLRAYEWDRINFSTPQKIEATANMFQISIEKLNIMRKQTRENALKMMLESKPDC